MEYENIFGEKNKISLFDFSYNLNIPFYEVYFYYDSYGKDCISYFTENEFSKLFKKNLELYMKLFDQEFLINNYKKFYDKIDFIKDLKEKTLFKMILFIESNAKQNINSDTYKFNSIDEFLSLLLLFDDKEIINKDCINIKDEIFIKNIIRDIINNKEISREDLKKIYLITDNKIVSLRINTYLMDALINNNYDFLQEHKSKVINFNSLKKDN